MQTGQWEVLVDGKEIAVVVGNNDLAGGNRYRGDHEIGGGFGCFDPGGGWGKFREATRS